jgi:hypothetical protein
MHPEVAITRWDLTFGGSDIDLRWSPGSSRTDIILHNGKLTAMYKESILR